MDYSRIPQDWFCPITNQVMTDPVIASDGHTYERKALEELLSGSCVSPATQTAFANKNIIPNKAMKSTIDQMLPEYVKHGASTTRQKPANNTEVRLETETMVVGEHLLVNVSVVPPKEQAIEKRKKCSIICVLDISGSMDTQASQQTAADTEQHGFSRLDLVKHSVNTVINCLGDGDYLALVPFSDTAEVRLPLTEMNAHGKQAAEKMIKDMRTEGSTNIWDGLRVGLDLTQHEFCSNRNTFVLLLTDGEPNVNPPEGNLQALKNYIGKNGLNSNIHVFGYGYQLDTILLTGVAKQGIGSYGYIPDCSMVGTIFVNFLSNSLATLTNLAQLTIQPHANTKFQKIIGSDKAKTVINLGGIQYGQNRDVMLQFALPKHEGVFADVTLNYGFKLRKHLKVSLDIKDSKHSEYMEFQINRGYHIEGLRVAYQNANNLQKGVTVVNETLKKLKNSPIFATDEKTKCLVRDIESPNENQGQVGKAFQKQEWYNKWGKHYIPALLRAHILQVCTNFKDPGLQIYGGELFKKLQNEIDTVFIKLPPPEPTIKTNNYVAPASMAAYYNYGGGCIYGECNVMMADGTIKKVRDVKKGDKVRFGNSMATVQCVLRTKVNKVIEMSSFPGGLIITPYHPIKCNGAWYFPNQLGDKVRMFVNEYFNFVLEGGHSLTVDGMECISLGHGLTDSAVVSHEYLGTGKIIEDLKEMKGWEHGLVEVGGFERDPASLRITKVTMPLQQS